MIKGMAKERCSLIVARGKRDSGKEIKHGL